MNNTTSGQQPQVQYGCRAMVMTSLDPPTLQVDSTGTPVVLGSVTEQDLEAVLNEGPGSCEDWGNVGSRFNGQILWFIG